MEHLKVFDTCKYLTEEEKKELEIFYMNRKIAFLERKLEEKDLKLNAIKETLKNILDDLTSNEWLHENKRKTEERVAENERFELYSELARAIIKNS